MTVDSRLMEQEQSLFPSLSVENMNQSQLRELIPKLVQVISQISNMKPDWWPDKLSWSCVRSEYENNLEDPSYTEIMRNAVQKCYRQFGQEELLSVRPNIQKPRYIKPPSRGMVLQEVNQVPPSYNNTNTQCKNDSRHQQTRTEPVWICIMCAKAFTDQDTLTKHQDTCEDDIETKQPSPVVEPLKRLIRRPKRKRKFFMSELYNFPSQDVYFSSLGLAPPPKTGKFVSTKKPVENETMTLKDFEEPCSPAKTPHTPKYRTQWSHEGGGSACKRKFSFSSPSHHNVESDDSSQDDDDEEEEEHGGSLRNSLLCIDFSSELGKKFNKFLKPVSSMPLIPSFESYCSTPMKNEFLDKLRYRSSDYPVTFKAKKKYLKSYTHEMRFSATDRHEFMKTVETGLNKRSRLLKKRLTKCHVLLHPVTKSEIENWSHPKRKAIRQAPSYPQQMFYVDNDTDCQPRPMMLFQNSRPLIQDFRLQGASRVMSTPTTHLQSYPELQKQLLTPSIPKLVSGSQSNVAPHFLVKKLDKNFDGRESQRFVYVPMFHTDTGDGITQQRTGLPSSSENSVRRDTVNQRRKQNFEKIRDDDEICIVCMSSDEEESQSEKLAEGVKQQTITKNVPVAYTKPQSQVLGNSAPRPVAKMNSREKPCILTSQSQVARNNSIRRTTVNPHELNWASTQQNPSNPALEILRAQLESKRNFNAQIAHARSHQQTNNPVVRPYMNNERPCTRSDDKDDQLTISAVYSLNEKDASTSLRTVFQPGNKFQQGSMFLEHTRAISAGSPDIATVLATVNDYSMEEQSRTTPAVSRIQVDNETVEVICIDDDD